MPYVERNKDNVIFAIYNRPQPGRAEEFLPDGDAEVVAFLNPPQPPSISSITLFADKTQITADGVDASTITATFNGVEVDTFTCYITIDGVVGDIAEPITGGQVVREFTSAEARTFKVKFYAGGKSETAFVEAV